MNSEPENPEEEGCLHIYRIVVDGDSFNVVRVSDTSPRADAPRSQSVPTPASPTRPKSLRRLPRLSRLPDPPRLTRSVIFSGAGALVAVVLTVCALLSSVHTSREPAGQPEAITSAPVAEITLPAATLAPTPTPTLQSPTPTFSRPAARKRPRTADAAALAARSLTGLEMRGVRGTEVRGQAREVARTAADTTASTEAPFNGYLYDLPRNGAFKVSWSAAVSALPNSVRQANPWLVTLESTAAPNEAIETPEGARYVLATGCDPRDCTQRSLRVVFNRRTGTVAAAAYLAGTWYWFGSDAVVDRGALLATVARARLRIADRFPLPAPGAAAVERFVAAVQ
jgi:hypothetical protein